MSQTTVQKRKIAIPFFATIGAAGTACLASDQITFDFVVTKIEAHFADDCANNLRVYPFLSSNRNTSYTTPPPDTKLMGYYSPTPYLIGNGESVEAEAEVKPATNEKYLKVFFANTNTYQVYGYCIITIETPEELLGIKGISAVVKSENEWTLEEFKGTYDKKANALQDQVLEAIGGSQAWLRTHAGVLNRANGETVNTLNADAQKIATMTAYLKPSMHNDDFIPALQKWFEDANALMSKYSAADVAGEIAGLGLINFTSTLVQRDEQTWGVGKEMGEINKITYDSSINEYVRQSANLHFQAMIPSTSELINEVVKEVIDLDTFKYNMKLQGINELWSQRIWDAHYIQPTYQQLMLAIHRRAIDPNDRYKWYKLLDLDPRFNERIWDALYWEHPPYQELINMRVKEVISELRFEDEMMQIGIQPGYSTLIWDAHFTPPTVTDFLTAWRRKETVLVPKPEGASYTHTFGEDTAKDMEVLHELTILADYDPRYQTFFDTRFYNDPTPRLARWAFESGDVDEDRIKDIVHRFGYYPKDEEWISDMFIHFQERPWVTKYLTALASAYIADAITGDDLKGRVKAIPRNEAIADWIIKIADVRKEIQAKSGGGSTQKLLSVTDLKKGFLHGKIDETGLRTRLQLMGYEELDIQLLIDIMSIETEEIEAGGQKKGLTTAEYFNAFRYGEISEDELRTQLMLKGLNLQEANILINTKKKAWGVGGIESQGGD